MAPVQRAPIGPSRGDPKLTVNGESGVITAVVAGAGSGHTIIYIEQAAGNWKLELNAVAPEAINVEQPTKYDLAKLNESTTKRSWLVSNAQIDAALDKARDIQANAKDYQYKFIGTGLPFAIRKAINCARFGEEILKSAGIPASSGVIFKTPMELATGKKKFFKPRSGKAVEPPPHPTRSGSHSRHVRGLTPGGHRAVHSHVPPPTGSVKLKVDPRPRADSTQIFPPWASTIPRVIASPRPAPPASRERDFSPR